MMLGVDMQKILFRSPTKTTLKVKDPSCWNFTLPNRIFPSQFNKNQTMEVVDLFHKKTSVKKLWHFIKAMKRLIKTKNIYKFLKK